MPGSVALYLLLLAALVVERVVELAITRRNLRRLFARGAVEAGRGHFPAMVALHALFPLACAAEVIALRRPFPGALGWAALAGVALAQALRYWAVATLGERWSTRIVLVPGEPPITGGPYRFVRHPNYLAVALEVLCVPLVHGAYLTAAVFTAANAVVLAVRIRAEERALGTAWEAAMAGRPRFVPGGRR